MQLVIMTIPVGGEIGQVSACVRVFSTPNLLTVTQEIHHVDQHLSFHSGTADAIVNGKTVRVEARTIYIARRMECAC